MTDYVLPLHHYAFLDTITWNERRIYVGRIVCKYWPNGSTYGINWSTVVPSLLSIAIVIIEKTWAVMVQFNGPAVALFSNSEYMLYWSTFTECILCDFARRIYIGTSSFRIRLTLWVFELWAHTIHDVQWNEPYIGMWELVSGNYEDYCLGCDIM